MMSHISSPNPHLGEIYSKITLLEFDENCDFGILNLQVMQGFSRAFGTIFALFDF